MVAPPTDRSHSLTDATHQRRHPLMTTASFVVLNDDKVGSEVGCRQIWVPVSLSVVGWVVGDGF